MTIASTLEESDNKTARKKSISGRYFPSSGVSGRMNQTVCLSRPLSMPVDAVAVQRVVPDPASIQFSI
jgi:hypothetical protein